MSESCPADYSYPAADLNRAADFAAETLYVVGGLYGNPEALAAVEAMAARETRAGRTVTLLFNGDWHWFDVQPAVFGDIETRVAGHRAVRGNVETELARPDGGYDCGCAYPDYVEPGVAARANAIFERLARTAARFPGHKARLAGLPAHAVAAVGGRRVAIVHGDPESLSGWGLAEEALVALDDPARAPLGALGTPIPQTSGERIAAWFRAAGVDAIASTHTCLPFARDFVVDGQPRLAINNGAAGMPNLRGTRHGLLTRISAHPAVPADSLYGMALGGVRYDALPVAYDHERWLARFRADWPAGSPAHTSYHRRICEGPDYGLAQAMRGNVLPGGLRRSA